MSRRRSVSFSALTRTRSTSNCSKWKKGYCDASILWGGGSVVPVDSVFFNEEKDTLFVTRISEVKRKAASGKIVRTHRFTEVILPDLRLGSEDALDLIKSIKLRHPNTRILMLSQHDEAIYAERSLRAGASGYVMKQEATEDVLVAIRTVIAGKIYVSRKMAVLVLHRLLDVPGVGGTPHALAR